MADDIEFLRSCVKAADSERDYYRAKYDALLAKVTDRAGAAVVEQWLLQIARGE